MYDGFPGQTSHAKVNIACGWRCSTFGRLDITVSRSQYIFITVLGNYVAGVTTDTTQSLRGLGLFRRRMGTNFQCNIWTSFHSMPHRIQTIYQTKCSSNNYYLHNLTFCKFVLITITLCKEKKGNLCTNLKGKYSLDVQYYCIASFLDSL